MPEIMQLHMEGCDAQSSTSILSQAVLKEATVIEYSSTMPCPVGVSISCVPSTEVTRTGKGYAFIALPETSNNHALCIYKNDATTAESMAWREQYPEYTSLNLETHGVLNVQGEGFVFVSKTHPVIDLLRANKEVLKADIDKQTLIDDQWVRLHARDTRATRATRAQLTPGHSVQLKVTKQVMSTCCAQIKSKVLNKVGTVDLSNISLQINRIDGPWTQIMENDPLYARIPQELTMKPDPPESQNNTTALAEFDEAQDARRKKFTKCTHDMLHKKHSFYCRFELVFELLPVALNP